MNDLHHRGEDWRYVFAEADGCLSHKDRETLLKGAIDIYKDNKKRRAIKGDNFEGELVNTRRDTYWPGSFVGRSIEGKLETDKGEACVHVIIARYQDPS